MLKPLIMDSISPETFIIHTFYQVFATLLHLNRFPFLTKTQSKPKSVDGIHNDL